MWKLIVAAVLLALGVVAWMLRSPGAPASSGTPRPMRAATSIAPASSPAMGWLENVRRAPASEFLRIFQELLDSPASSAREAALQALFTRWENEDLAGLIAALKAFPPGDPAWHSLLPAFVLALPRANDATAAAPSFQRMVARIAAAYAISQPDAALAWARRWLVGDGLDAALQAIIVPLAQKSPERATQLLGEIHDPLVRDGAVDEIADSLARAGSEAAFDWARTLPDELRTEGAKASLDALAKTDVHVALREFLRFRSLIVTDQPAANPSGPAFETLGDTASVIAEGLAATSGIEALDWAASLPPALRTDAARGALAGWAAAKPQDAAAYVLDRRDADGAEVVFEKWSAAAPEAAALQAQSLTDPALRESAVAGLLTGWQDAAGSADISNWAATLPAGPGRDAVNAVLARDLSAPDPQKAWQCAASIEDAAARASVLREIVKTTAEVDPAAAKALIEADKTLSAAEVATLREAAIAPDASGR
jgi:hypothetical protein